MACRLASRLEVKGVLPSEEASIEIDETSPPIEDLPRIIALSPVVLVEMVEKEREMRYLARPRNNPHAVPTMNDMEEETYTAFQLIVSTYWIFTVSTISGIETGGGRALISSVIRSKRLSMYSLCFFLFTYTAQPAMEEKRPVAIVCVGSDR